MRCLPLWNRTTYSEPSDQCVFGFASMCPSFSFAKQHFKFKHAVLYKQMVQGQELEQQEELLVTREKLMIRDILTWLVGFNLPLSIVNNDRTKSILTFNKSSTTLSRRARRAIQQSYGKSISCFPSLLVSSMTAGHATISTSQAYLRWDAVFPTETCSLAFL